MTDYTEEQEKNDFEAQQWFDEWEIEGRKCEQQSLAKLLGDARWDARQDLLTILKEASVWLHVAYDHPLQTDESITMLARVDAHLKETL